MGRTHNSAITAYVSVCSASLVFCLAKTQAAAGSGPASTADPTLLARASMSSNVPAVAPLGLLGVLEALLQTQLGVFVFANFVIACCAALAAITTSVFLESLTPSEAGRLTQRLLKYLLFKVALVGMVVLPSEAQLLHWLPWLAVIGEMKMFVGLAKDRLAGLSVTPAVGLSRHVRTLCLLGFILGSNVLGLALLHRHQGALSWAVRLLFALDLGIISVEASKAALSCVSLLMDEALAISTPSLQLSATLSGRAMAFWDSWQGKGRERFFYHTELYADVAVHVLTLLHHVYVWLLHGMSFHLLDALLLLDTRVVLASFVQRVKAHMLHRAATHSLDHSFPDAAEKLLHASDAECAICRDKLAAAKQLPCGHLFHLPCLRAWLQQSGHDNFKCPICRRALCVQAAHLAPGRSEAAGSRHGGAAGGLAGAAQQQQQWRLAGGGSPAGLMGHLSLSMSYNDLTGAVRGTGQVSLEEQLLLAGLADDAQLADAQLAAGPMGALGGDADSFDALLAQALAASLQTAHMPPSEIHEAAAAAAADAHQDTDNQIDQGAPAAAAPAAVAVDSSARSGREQQESAALLDEQQQQRESAAGQASQQGSQGQQALCGDSSGAGSSSRRGMHRRRSGRRTASLPPELLAFNCCKEESSQHMHAGTKADTMQHFDDEVLVWSDPLSDSDVLPSSRYSVRDTCSRMLASLMQHSTTSSQPNAAAASSSSSSSSSSQASPGTDLHAAATSSKQGCAHKHHRAVSRLHHRHSWSCSNLSDMQLQAAGGGGASSSKTVPARGTDQGPLQTGVDAVAAGADASVSSSSSSSVQVLLAQPRDPIRRRQGGRWGRRRIVVEQEDGVAPTN